MLSLGFPSGSLLLPQISTGDAYRIIFSTSRVMMGRFCGGNATMRNWLGIYARLASMMARQYQLPARYHTSLARDRCFWGTDLGYRWVLGCSPDIDADSALSLYGLHRLMRRLLSPTADSPARPAIVCVIFPILFFGFLVEHVAPGATIRLLATSMEGSMLTAS